MKIFAKPRQRRIKVESRLAGCEIGRISRRYNNTQTYPDGHPNIKQCMTSQNAGGHRAGTLADFVKPNMGVFAKDIFCRAIIKTKEEQQRILEIANDKS